VDAQSALRHEENVDSLIAEQQAVSAKQS